MVDLLLYLFVFGLFALAIVGGYLMLRGQLGGQSPMAAMFGPKPEKRLAIVEHTNLDGRRRLVLVRRDGIEHLIMTGGPVDVVIETGIGAKSELSVPRARAVATDDEPPTFQRRARFGRSDKSEEAAQ